MLEDDSNINMSGIIKSFFFMSASQEDREPVVQTLSLFLCSPLSCLKGSTFNFFASRETRPLRSDPVRGNIIWTRRDLNLGCRPFILRPPPVTTDALTFDPATGAPMTCNTNHCRILNCLHPGELYKGQQQKGTQEDITNSKCLDSTQISQHFCTKKEFRFACRL